MTLTEAITRIAALTKKLSTDSTSVIPRIRGHVNEICRREWNTFPWTFRNREYHFKLEPEVTTGTVSVTNGSNTVTFSSAVLTTSEHKGWYFRVVGDSPTNWYRVNHVISTTQANIGPAYLGTTSGTATYELRKLDYNLPPEVDEVILVKVLSDSGYVSTTDIPSISESSPVMTEGSPMVVRIYESNPIASTYTTGTVTGTSGQTSLTGASSPAWLSNILPGDVLTISGNNYTVYEVLTDTAITLYNKLKTSPSATAYTATRSFVQRLRIYPPSDQSRTVMVLYRRKYHDLVNDADSNELLDRHESAVVQSCVELEQISSPDSRADAQNLRAADLWAAAKVKDRGMVPKVKRRPIFSNRTYRR